MMNLKDHPSIVISTLVVAVAVGVATIFFAVGQAVANNRIAELETKIETLELSQQLELPDLLDSLRGAADELSDQMQLFARISELEQANLQLRTDLEQSKSDVQEASIRIDTLQGELDEKIESVNALNLEVGSLEEDNLQLKNDLEQQTSRLNEALANAEDLQAQLNEKNELIRTFYLDSETFTLGENESKSFGGYDVIAGIQDIGPNGVALVFGGEKSTVGAGEVITIARDGKQYQLILDGFDYIYDRATFTFVVKEEQ